MIRQKVLDWQSIMAFVVAYACTRRHMIFVFGDLGLEGHISLAWQWWHRE